MTLSVTLICVSLVLLASISGGAPKSAYVGDEQLQGVITNEGAVTSFAAPPTSQDVVPDFVNSRPMPLPRAVGPIDITEPPPEIPGLPDFSPGETGNGQTNPITLPLPAVSDLDMEPMGPEPEEYGTSNLPFSTARADLSNVATNTQYPYRASGKLWFQKAPPDNSWYVCSASMVKRGVVVTAAHCVANYGRSTFYRNFRFYPGYRSGAAPYGAWSAYRWFVTTAYFNGTDNCYQYGVICPDDVATLVLNTNASGNFAGTYTGWYAYGWNGYGFVNGQTQITQIGYPSGLDNGVLMERNDSRGSVSTYSSNTLIGSLMSVGSSGGPWTVNFGIRPALTGIPPGSAAAPNVVVGVTSWEGLPTSGKRQGASPFTSNNIVPLISAACTARPAACQ
jgi:V8-like Glu-specific endopeptidase